MRAWFGAAALLLYSSLASAEPIEVTSSPVPAFQNLSTATEFGPLTWRGGLFLKSADAAFGGLSGLALSENCEDLLAISDAGRWFTAKLGYSGGALAAIADTELAPMLDSKGKRQRYKIWSDAEAIAAIAPGKFAVAYESKVRLGIYDIGRKGFAAPFQHAAYPKSIDLGPDNGEIEALGLLPSGAMIAIAEKHHDAQGNHRAWTWRGKSAVPFAIARYLDYDITDLAVLPGGSVLTLERSFTRTSLPGMVIRRFAAEDIRKNATVKPELLFEGRLPFFVIDNMEGLAVCARDGETRLTIVSDNNFNTRLQSTLLLQFAYRP